MTAREIAILIVQPITDRLTFDVGERAARAGILAERREVLHIIRSRRDSCTRTDVPCSCCAELARVIGLLEARPAP